MEILQQIQIEQPLEKKNSFQKTQEALALIKHIRANPLKAQDEAERWFLEVEDQEETLSIIQHTALIALVQSGLFSHGRIKNAEARLRTRLIESRTRLTGKLASEKDMALHLPKKILRRISREEVLYHQSIFHSGVLNLADSIKVLWQDYIPRWRDLITLILLVATLSLSAWALEVFTGLVIGYIFSTIMEYLVHLLIGHANPKIKKKLTGFGAIGRDMLNFHLEHSIHHGSVHQNYIEAFAPSHLLTKEDSIQQSHNKQRMDNLIFNRGGERLLQLIHKSNYGLSSSNIWRTHLFFLPASLLVSAFLVSLGNMAGCKMAILFHLGFLLLSQLWITTSSAYHPYLHMSAEKVEAEGHWFWKLILNTRISKFVIMSHRMHHVLGGGVNENLNIGFDFFVGWAPITFEELVELKKRNVIC